MEKYLLVFITNGVGLCDVDAQFEEMEIKASELMAKTLAKTIEAQTGWSCCVVAPSMVE